MRILHVVTSLDPEFGGTAESVRMMLEHAPEGCESEVVAIDDPEAAFLRDIEFPVHALGPRRSPYSYTPKLMPWLRANRERFDGVVVHGMWQYCGVAVWRALGGQVPYIVFAHGMLDPYFKRAFPGKHWKKWAYWVAAEYWVLRGAQRVAFTCEAERVLAEQSFWLHRWRAWVAPFGTIAPGGRCGGAARGVLCGVSGSAWAAVFAVPGADRCEEGMRSAGGGVCARIGRAILSSIW